MEKAEMCIWVLKQVKQKYSYVIFSNINYTFFITIWK